MSRCLRVFPPPQIDKSALSAVPARGRKPPGAVEALGTRRSAASGPARLRDLHWSTPFLLHLIWGDAASYTPKFILQPTPPLHISLLRAAFHPSGLDGREGDLMVVVHAIMTPWRSQPCLTRSIGRQSQDGEAQHLEQEGIKAPSTIFP